MDKYEFKLSLDEINKLVQERRFEEAANIADSIDWNHVRSVQTLGMIGEIYKIVGDYGRSRDIMEIAYQREPENPSVVYSLCELSLHLYGTGALQSDLARGLQMLQEYQVLAPSNPKRLILQYRMYDVSHVSAEEKITVLEQLKKEKPSARWEYELARQYAENGDVMRAAAVCTDVMEIFGGKYGAQAQQLLQRLQLDQQTEAGAAAVDTESLQQAMEERPAAREAENPTVQKPADLPPAEERKEIPADAEISAKAGEVTARVDELPAKADEIPADSEFRREAPEDSLTHYRRQPRQEEVHEPVPQPKEATSPETESSGPDIAWKTLSEPEREVQEHPGQVTNTEASISEVMAEWERIRADIRRANDEKRAQRILEDTGNILQNFDETARHGLLEDIEKGVARQRRQVRGGRYGMPDSDTRRNDRPQRAGGADQYDEPSYEEGDRYGEPVYEDADRYGEPDHERQDRYDEPPYEGEDRYGGPVYEGADHYDEPPYEGEDRFRESAYERQDRYDGPSYEGEGRYGEPVYEGADHYDEPSYEERDRYGESAYEREDRYDESAYDRQDRRKRQDKPAYEEEDRYDEPVYGRQGRRDEPVYDDRQEQNSPDTEYLDSEYEPSDEQVNEFAPEPEKALERESGAKPKYSDAAKTAEAAAKAPERAEAARPGKAPAAAPESAGIPVSNDEDDTRVYQTEVSDAATRRWNAEEVHRAVLRSQKERAAAQKKASAERARIEQETARDLKPAAPETGNSVTAAARRKEKALEDAFYEELNETVSRSAARERVPQRESQYREPVQRNRPVSGEEFEEERVIPAESAERSGYEQEQEETSYESPEPIGEEGLIPEEPIYSEEYETQAGPDLPERKNRREEELPEDAEEGYRQQADAPAPAEQQDDRKESDEPVPESTPAQDGSDSAAAKGKRELTREERRLFGPFCRMKDNVDQLTEALDQISLSSATGNLLILGNEATADRVAKGILDIVRRSDPNFTGKIAKATGESLSRLDAKGFARTMAKLENGALIVTHAADIAPKTLERMYQEIEGHEHGLVLILTDGNKKMEQFRSENAQYLGSFTAVITIRPLDDKALVSYARDYALSQDYSIDEFGQLALAQRISSMQTQTHHVTLKEVRDLVDEAIGYASKKNMNTLMGIVTRKRYDEDDRIILHEKDFSHY